MNAEMKMATKVLLQPTHVLYLFDISSQVQVVLLPWRQRVSWQRPQVWGRELVEIRVVVAAVGRKVDATPLVFGPLDLLLGRKKSV